MYEDAPSLHRGVWTRRWLGASESGQWETEQRPGCRGNRPYRAGHSTATATAPSSTQSDASKATGSADTRSHPAEAVNATTAVSDGGIPGVKGAALQVGNAHREFGG